MYLDIVEEQSKKPETRSSHRQESFKGETLRSDNKERNQNL
jgi:hypothetical protein